MGIAESHRGPSGKQLPGFTMGVDEAVARLRALLPYTQTIVAYLFGSYAKGESTPSSDLDIAVLVEGQREALYQSFRSVMLAIRDTLGTERFDLLLLNDAPPTLKFEVITTGRLVYARSDHELNAFEEQVIRTYQDTAYLRAVQDDYLRRRARAWCSANRA